LLFCLAHARVLGLTPALTSAPFRSFHLRESVSREGSLTTAFAWIRAPQRTALALLPSTQSGSADAEASAVDREQRASRTAQHDRAQASLPQPVHRLSEQPSCAARPPLAPARRAQPRRSSVSSAPQPLLASLPVRFHSVPRLPSLPVWYPTSRTTEGVRGRGPNRAIRPSQHGRRARIRNPGSNPGSSPGQLRGDAR
jgi:hypothetical protein